MAALQCDIPDLMDSDSIGDRKVKRFRLTHNQSRYLMSEFARQAHPDASQRDRLSREIPGLTPRQVQVWFQNRRAKLKRMSSDDRYRMMKSRALPDEFPILQTLHSYDLNFASRPPGPSQDAPFRPQERQRSSTIESHASSTYSLGSSSRLSCSTDVSSASCQISPTSPQSAQLSNEQFARDDRSYSFSDPTGIRLQPLNTFYNPDVGYKPMQPGCILPDSQSDSRFAKNVGAYWQSPVDPSTWRRSIDIPFSSGMNLNANSSPHSGTSSMASDEYFAENMSKQNQHEQQQQLSAPPDAQAFNLGYVSASSNYLSMPLSDCAPRSSNVERDHERNANSSTFRKGHRTQRSLSQPPDFPLTRTF